MYSESEKQFIETIQLQAEIISHLKEIRITLKAELESSNEARNYYEKLHKQALSDLFKDNVLFPCEN